MSSNFKVVVKAAIFNYDMSRVLVIHMDRNNDYGLPGGHVEEGEGIDDAIKRELYEECGIQNIDLIKSDFFTHSNGKIVLAYTGILNESESVVSTQDNLEGIPKLLSKEEFLSIHIELCYRDFVLKSWV